jgi:hypothetical protein
VNRMIAGVRVVENLTPRGALCTPCEIQPTNEYQIRPLTVLEPDQQCEVWEEAVRSADGKTVTFKQVKALVEKITGPTQSPPQKKKKDPKPYSDAMHFATIAISQLSRIREEDPKRKEALKEVIKWINEQLKEE